ncbi:hypothetical protein [Microbacterium sediminicola]|uniref:hypothetical protein n=1 Tax=Microbacterium sediminicola TaxID=415210 RepID=UPI0031DD4991
MTADAPRGGIHERWVVFVAAEDRSGALTALAETFSARGVSFTSFTTLLVHDGVGVMSITFAASERLARVLVRTLDRLAVVRTTTLRHLRDDTVRATAVVSGADAAARAAGAQQVAGTWVIAGAFPDVEDAIARVRAAGGRADAVTILPPAD